MPATPAPSDGPSETSPLELTTGHDPLPAGTYTRSGFEPSVTFDIGDGWVAGSVLEGFFDVQQDPGTPDVVAVQFGNVIGVVGPDGAAVAGMSAAEAGEAIQSNAGLTILGTSDARLGGLTGVTVEVENSGDAHVQILAVPPGNLGIDSGRALWISLFDTSNGVLAVMVGGPIDGWPQALALAEPVLESVVIED